ncbi:MAG: acyl-CoA/acyl-ACP dehydrogenase [Holophagales bacterium]|nr:acyl-CoA/acyl-ACP dehydrogenase [Holophagales bacterium]
MSLPAPRATEHPKHDPAGDDWMDIVRHLGETLAESSPVHDREGSFVEQSFVELRRARLLSVAIPTELGGGGATHAETCDLLRELARHCPSTALTLSMHTHLVAASVFKLKRGAPEEALQRRIAEEQIFLVSTGATDWLASNGEMRRVDGGYRYSGRKVFASGSPTAALMITSGRYQDPEAGAQVLHFPIPFDAEGVEIQDDWDTLGMRGTGSHTVTLHEVFVPEEKIALCRPAGEWHAVWNVVGGVALPIIMSVYRGIAEKARDLAVAKARSRQGAGYFPALVGELENHLTATQLAVDSMIALSDNYRFTPSLELANAMLVRKTLAAEAAQATVRKAVEVAGGSAFFRSVDGVGLEQLMRDVQAAAFHPLPKPRQLHFSGRVALGLDPAASG